MPRLDFTKKTIDTLAERAGYCCSFPGCGRPTSGPSSEAPDATSNTGTACHIISASQGAGARRNFPEICSDKIKDISNGIWMCGTHGRIIDNDEITYSVEMLKTWKEIAEFKAKYEQEHGKTFDIELLKHSAIPVVEERVDIQSNHKSVNETIGHLFINCCIPYIWGAEAAEAIRDFTIEMIRNAFQHGKANDVTVHVSPLRVSLQYTAPEFNPITTLLDKGQGGRDAVQHIYDNFGDQVITTYSYNDTLNEIIACVPNSSKEVIDATPCAMFIDNSDPEEKTIDDFLRTESCGTIYVVLPRFFTWSDVRPMKDILVDHVPDGKRIVFVAEDLSVGVADSIRRNIPGANVIRLRGR